MGDNLHVVWDKFHEHRTKPIWERFPGVYRSLVVETDDPLNMGRIRFQCPDLHDYDVKPEACPWATAANEMGGKGSGHFSSPVIGDFVWVTFERQHPYGPVWVGYATPTRRKSYPLASIHIETPIPVDAEGRPQSKPDDYNDEYLPGDRRPMSHGWKDRYGHLDISTAVGFYPKEHEKEPPPPGHDAVQGSDFQANGRKPRVNEPDLKYMARVTKYGNMLVLGDQGYWWHKSNEKKDDGTPADNVGEFTGDFEQDSNFEISRQRYMQKLLNEGQPNSSIGGKAIGFGDQRRFGAGTRYGHKFELRDVGWAQKGPIESTSRDGEYGEPRTLSVEDTNDFRWAKLRTKGGWLLQAYDKGFHPQDDKFIKRKLIDEVGHLSEREDKHWKYKDARWFRISGRYGTKFVIDDRGSHDTEADEKELPRGNGILIKGRRSPGAAKKQNKGNPRGFYFEWNENDELNHLTMGTPLGAALEFNDRYEYVCLATSLGKGYSTKWRGLKENEFLLHPTRHPDRDPEHKSHHLVIDHENEYIRYKTRAGKGPKPDHVVNLTAVTDEEEHQGLEARDGENGMGPWVELVDCQSRGMWFSKNNRLGIWRGRRGSFMYQWIDDDKHVLAMYNDNSDGKIQIYSRGDVEIMGAKSITINGFDEVKVKAGRKLTLQGGNSILTLKDNQILHSNALFPGGEPLVDLNRPDTPTSIEPDDRAKIYNGPIEECPREEVEHPIPPGEDD